MLSNLLGALGESGIRLWLRLFGRPAARSEHRWLDNPIGPRGRIGEALYDSLAEQEGLEVRRAPDGAGLIADFGALRGDEFDPDTVDNRIRHFYEHSSTYQLDAWSETSLFTRIFLWFLVTFVSRRIDQLNFPTSSMDTSRGVTSDVIQLVDPASGEVVRTGWLRKAAGSGRVIYAGFYSVERPGAHPSPCVQVSFPLPLGHSTVFLRPEAQADGSLKLISAGKKFGDPGYYRVLDEGSATLKVRHLRSLQERFHVYVDERGDLRTDHSVRFMGLAVLRLHYKMSPRVIETDASRTVTSRETDHRA
jgi:hypothetical protein